MGKAKGTKATTKASKAKTNPTKAKPKALVSTLQGTGKKVVKEAKATRTAVFSKILQEGKPLTVDEINTRMLKLYPSGTDHTKRKSTQYLSLLRDCNLLKEKDGKISLKK